MTSFGYSSGQVRKSTASNSLNVQERAYGAGAALDEMARNSLKALIRDLQEELADAEDMNDMGRAELAR